MVRKKNQQQDKQQRYDQPQKMPDARGTEKTLSDIVKLIHEQDFHSVEEVDDFLQGMLKSGQPMTPSQPASRDAVGQAQQLMYDAWDAQGPKRLKLAHKALDISKDCADAYVLLAEEAASNLEEAKEFYQLGMAAGERALGQQTFEEDVGHFWGFLETRPYMRARHGLAECLWLLGQHQEALAHYREMLVLNPNDNQGIRYELMLCLLEEEDDEAVEKLFKQYEKEALLHNLI